MFSEWHWLHFFPRLLKVTFSPEISFRERKKFGRANTTKSACIEPRDFPAFHRHRLHVFLRLTLVSSIPAHAADCMFSRACEWLQISPACYRKRFEWAWIVTNFCGIRLSQQTYLLVNLSQVHHFFNCSWRYQSIHPYISSLSNSVCSGKMQRREKCLLKIVFWIKKSNLAGNKWAEEKENLSWQDKFSG